MEHASKSVWAALRRIAKPEKPLDLLIAVWPLMVGARLAAHTRPAGWNGSRLDVGVEEGPWQAQVERLSKPIRAKVNAWWGGKLVREVRFVAPKRKKRAAAPPEPPVPAHGKPAGTEVEDKLREVMKELEQPLAQISDEELRELIARVAASYLEKGETK
jgi:hypothetical protein